MAFKENKDLMLKALTKKPIMILGTTSGAGKSLITAAICRYLMRNGETPIPFKGQNMSNNAWVDNNCREMAYSQAVQAWAAGIEPICEMNPVLLKPQGDCKSEVIHLGKSVGISDASEYYEKWFKPGWQAIQKGIFDLTKQFKNGRFVIEGAGSPVEMNLQHRDLTNLRLAKYLNADCILIADIERGGVFAQLVGTLHLLQPNERKLIKGIIINKFRGDITLFNNGKSWIEEHTKIPVLGIMPWLKDIFPPEDSLDLLERKQKKIKGEIEIVVIKLGSISNFSDLDPLEAEESISLKWLQPGEQLGQPDVVIIPGSKQTIKDLKILKKHGLENDLKDYVKNGGSIFGVCGGMQILGESLYDPNFKEDSGNKSFEEYQGLCLLPIKTIFEPRKSLKKRHTKTLWPKEFEVSGFEMHYGNSSISCSKESTLKPMFNDPNLGWVQQNRSNGIIAGTYLHGIFENGGWRRQWINEIRQRKKLPPLELIKVNHAEKREELINRLTDTFDMYINLSEVI